MKYLFVIFLSIILPIISLKKSTPKICNKCKHFIPDKDFELYGKCALFPKRNGKINFLVNGIMNDEYFYCTTSRDSSDMCGEEGKYYKRKIVRKLRK
jgi:hypothetical protein